MISLDVCLHPYTTDPAPATPVRLSGVDYAAVTPGQSDRQRTFDISFEEAAEHLERLDRLHFEPDGSFVWVGDGWQLDGMVYDRNGRISHIEVKGQAPAAVVERLLAVFGWPKARLLFQLTQSGVFLGEAEFRRFTQF